MSPLFSQRYGYEPLPEPMRLEELASDLRREIWNAVREMLVEKRKGYIENYYFEASGKSNYHSYLGRSRKEPFGHTQPLEP